MRCTVDAARQQGQVRRPTRHCGGGAGSPTAKPEVRPLPTVPWESLKQSCEEWPALTYPQCPPSADHSCLGAHPLCYPACRPLPRHRGFYLWPIHSFPITQHSFSHSLHFISSVLPISARSLSPSFRPFSNYILSWNLLPPGYLPITPTFLVSSYLFASGSFI